MKMDADLEGMVSRSNGWRRSLQLLAASGLCLYLGQTTLAQEGATASAVPASAPATSVPLTPSASPTTNGVVSLRVPIPDPVMERPSELVLAGMASRERETLVNAATQDSLETGLRRSLEPRTVEEGGGAGRWVKRDKSLRAIGQLFDPFAPLPKPYRAAAPDFERAVRGEEYLPASLRGAAAPTLPRTFIDERTHEYGLRLW